MIRHQNVPMLLRERPQWVLWKTITRDKPTKVPFSVNGEPAKANDPATWSTFDDALARYEQGGYDGIGYEFSASDPFVGIDLDGCRDPSTGKLADWAKAIVLEFNTYAEVSPSETGVKLFGIGKLPFGSGRKVELSAAKVCDKTPAIEVYDHLRYFAVTGLRLTGLPIEPVDVGKLLAALCEQHWPERKRIEADSFYQPQAVIERARKYIAKCPPSVSGSSGHNAAFHVACVLVMGFQLDPSQALIVMREWNQLCQPPWSERELQHKIDSAQKQPGERGFLRNVKPQQWAAVSMPVYDAPDSKPPRPMVSTAQAAQQYIERLRAGKTELLTTGLPGLDAAIGGGVDYGEMVIIAARPSHGKSTVALQCAHHWTAQRIPVLFVTEEMSATSLGKRTLQYASALPQEQWRREMADLEIDLHDFASERSDCYIVENCGTTAAAVVEIERAVAERGIRAAIVDYAQLLTSPGKSRYEQITNTSIALRRVASEQKIVLLVLCQLNREIESRESFQPKTSDLKDTGQLEQDADVIIFLVWPHRIDQSRDPHNFKFYIAKNRNREIGATVVECRFEPSRQKLSEQTVRDMPNYHLEFAERDYDTR